ncbi:MAG TPA: class I SAM-dependent methyltransferase [Polyangiaceae bacterium]|nr:class I SAM-dependent methyltransferase [Polyangiaceae bacterium]
MSDPLTVMVPNEGALDAQLSRREELVLLKLFVPPYYYGDYLAFGAAGEPLGVLSPVAVSVLREAEERPARALVCGPGRDGPDPERVDALSELVMRGLVAPGASAPPLHEIAPDKGGGTRHTGRGADLFIRHFYRYFGDCFGDGSPLIDSHGDFLPVLEPYFPPPRPAAVCLDAGAGSGHYAAALARLGHHVYACDIDRARLEAVAARSAGAGTIQGLQCDLQDIPLPDGCVDFAMSVFVLEHVADPYAVTEELVRLLRPGGTLLLAVPSFNIRDTMAAWLHGELPTLNFEHLRSYGLVPRTHPWCEPLLDVSAHLRACGVEVTTVLGVNVLSDLWEPWASALAQIAAAHGPAFASTWPWNHLGRQTVFHGRKTP